MVKDLIVNHLGRSIEGSNGIALECLWSPEDLERPEMAATLATWFLTCPGQSPAWDNYQLSIIHLRDIEGTKPAIINVPQATHEVMLLALNPSANPVPTDSLTWSWLMPANVMEQVQLPSDEDAVKMLADCAQAVVDGVLPAEPGLAGAVEPWRTALLRTSAHYRGEEHAS